jgi:ATP-binding cassette subfamily C protein
MDEEHKDMFSLTEGPKLSFQQEIVVENLGFHYPKAEKNVFSAVNFRLPRGKFVGIIGPSGAGKTTFVDILLGLLPPTAGQIRVDGVDIQSNIRGWQANISYVPQTIYLSDGSIRENVALGVAADEIDDQSVEEALRMAELEDFIKELPRGVDTQVGECGSHLSGGQRQRIGIARAFYNHPEVLILDEATSALDNETEQSIMATILKLKGRLTIIAIAHRLSTLNEADFKIRFIEGRAEICP